MVRTYAARCLLVLVALGLAMLSGCVFHFADQCELCGGGAGGTPAACVPSTNASPVDDTCGVFVSSSLGNDATGLGTKAAPYQSLGAALSKAGSKPVYACAEAFKEAVTLGSKVELFGALDCTKRWTYDASKKTALAAASDAIPMTLKTTARGSTVHDFTITAADATVTGGSSIAVLDDGADLTLENVDLAAGNGKAGAPGMPQAQVATPATAAGGNGADNMCGATNNLGGPAGQNTCLFMGNMVDTSGGLGGDGTNGTTGGDGGGGNPKGMSTNGGAGQTTTSQCFPGQPGTQGSPGMPGAGARGIGDIDGSGYRGALASGGKSTGAPGQGGGGGGGANKCPGGGSGPGGGGGGAGGCGGAPGNPGQSGGASIGILAPSGTLTLRNATITTKAGGAGGAGGDGQAGANGGSAGHATVNSAACDGNKGGAGGRGGSGGGGAGGDSIGIAVKGGMPPDLGSTMIPHGMGGAGGSGGDMDATMETKGDDGLGCKTLDFANPVSCVM